MCNWISYLFDSRAFSFLYRKSNGEIEDFSESSSESEEEEETQDRRQVKFIVLYDVSAMIRNE